MIIKATNGASLKLTATQLTELDRHESEYPFHVVKYDLKAALECTLYDKLIFVRGHDSAGKVNTLYVKFDPVEGRIGCKEFAPATFNLILRTMGLLKKKAKAKKKR